MQQVHTDLALEARESVTEGKTGIPGVSVAEEVHRESGVRVTRDVYKRQVLNRAKPVAA